MLQREYGTAAERPYQTGWERATRRALEAAGFDGPEFKIRIRLHQDANGGEYEVLDLMDDGDPAPLVVTVGYPTYVVSGPEIFVERAASTVVDAYLLARQHLVEEQK